MDQHGLKTMYGLTASIGTAQTQNTWTYEELGEGIDNIAEAMNETVQQYFFMSDEGYARNHVTGAAPAFTFTGRRVVGDAAQDYIFSKKYALDGDRASSFKLEYTDAESQTVTLVVDCTLCSIQEWSGATTDDSAISFEVRFNGKPTVTTAAAG